MSQQVNVYRRLDFNLAAFKPDSYRTYSVMRMGDRLNEKNLTMTAAASQHLDPVQFNINVIGANPTSASTFNTIYQNITHDTTDMSYLRLKCADWNISIGQDVQDAYIFQGQINIAGDLTISGEACLSGLVMNASSGTITCSSVVGQIIQMGGASLPAASYGLIVRSASTATLTKGIYIETQTGTTITDGISLVNAGTFTNGINFSGAFTTGVNLRGVILTPDGTRGNQLIACGSRSTENTVTMASGTKNLDAIQLNMNVAGVAPTASTVNLSWMNITHDTTHMAALRLKCADWNIAIAKNIQDAYVYQGEIDITAASTISGEVVVLGLVANASAGTITGVVRGATIAMTGASMPAATSSGLFVYAGTGATLTHGIYLATQSATTMTNAIYVETAGTLTNVLKFDATSAAVVSTDSGGDTRSYKIRCAVGSVTGYLSLYTS